MDEIDSLAKKIWDYMHMNHKLEQSDIILCLGSRDMLPAHRACDLYFSGYAPVIIFSGNHGVNITLEKPEAEMYRDIAIERGVPITAIYIENKSCNTGENILFTKELIEKENLKHNKIILVQKPYMERRTYATFKKHWPEPEIFVTSPEINYEEYTENNPYDEKERIINRMVGDLQRIREYPKLGFQIEQEIPDDAWEAGQQLLSIGYNKYSL